jgi:preprotein translocase subunit YajC
LHNFFWDFSLLLFYFQPRKNKKRQKNPQNNINIYLKQKCIYYNKITKSTFYHIKYNDNSTKININLKEIKNPFTFYTIRDLIKNSARV